MPSSPAPLRPECPICRLPVRWAAPIDPGRPSYIEYIGIWIHAGNDEPCCPLAELLGRPPDTVPFRPAGVPTIGGTAPAGDWTWVDAARCTLPGLYAAVIRRARLDGRRYPDPRVYHDLDDHAAGVVSQELTDRLGSYASDARDYLDSLCVDGAHFTLDDTHGLVLHVSAAG
jgi:hypothetical protein